MAWNETLVTIVGTLTTDVTHRHTAEGVSTARFRIASTERRYNKEAQDWVDGETLYLAVSCWRRLADNARATLAKSDPVMVRGRLRIKSFETEGVRKQYAEIEAVSIGLDLSRCHSLHGAPEIVAPRADGEPVVTESESESELAPF